MNALKNCSGLSIENVISCYIFRTKNNNYTSKDEHSIRIISKAVHLDQRLFRRTLLPHHHFDRLGHRYNRSGSVEDPVDHFYYKIEQKTIIVQRHEKHNDRTSSNKKRRTVDSFLPLRERYPIAYPMNRPDCVFSVFHPFSWSTDS